MGVLDLFKRKSPLSRRASAAGGDEDLFDDEFQRKLDYLAMVSRRVFSGAMRAERRTKKTGSGVEFADHRDYVPGDDFRYLDWSAYQRFDRLLIRLYEEEEDLSIYFIVDASSSMAFGDGEKLRQAKRLCAALAYVGLANLDRIAIVTATDEISGRTQSTRGKARIFRVFRFLSGVRATLVSPGPVNTSLWDDIHPDTRKGFTARRDMLDANAVAAAVRYALLQPAEVNVDEIRLSRT